MEFSLSYTRGKMGADGLEHCSQGSHQCCVRRCCEMNKQLKRQTPVMWTKRTSIGSLLSRHLGVNKVVFI
jgi:hypothetical protein